MVKRGENRRSGDERAELRQALVAAEVPDEFIRALDEGQDMQTVMEAMVTAGVLPDADGVLDQVIAQWAPIFKRRTDPMTAELAGYEFLAAVRAAATNDDDLPMLLTDLVARAEKRSDATALAVLRLVAATAPDEVRVNAALAAERLAGRGLKNPRWAADIGKPTFVTSFGYRDAHGAQEAIAVIYAYGRRQHALVVLIDHDLGGGVKDCFPTDRPKAVRAQYLLTTRMTGMELRTHDPAQARAILDAALARPTCAMQEDQIEDLDSYLDLLRRRVDLLPGAEAGEASAGTGVSRRGPVAAATGKKAQVHRIKVTLRGAKPPIWRRLEVPSDVTLTRRHAILQEAFGWYNAHMWVFETGAGLYGPPDRELGHRSAERTTLNAVAPRTGARLTYVYDFGDEWVHQIAVEKVSPPVPGVAYPRCVAGRRAAPPEDCGGMWGYASLLEVLADPRHEEHRNALDWLGLESADNFNPDDFDVEERNEAIGPFRTVMVEP